MAGILGNFNSNSGLSDNSLGLLSMMLLNNSQPQSQPQGTSLGELLSSAAMGIQALKGGQGDTSAPGILTDAQVPSAQPRSPLSAPTMMPGETVPRLAYAIGQLESGGKYNAMGPMTKSGDRAYGRHQVMGANIPTWTQQVLGQSMTPQEFLNNPQAQDQVANHMLSKYYNQYGNIDDAASMWFSGRPTRGNNSKDILGTSVPSYVKRVNQIYYGT